MSTVNNFEDLEIWQMSRELVNMIYSDFKITNDFVFRNQIIKAGISIMNNIAEGFYRNSDSEFSYFLNISKGSAGEVKSMYFIAEDQKILNPSTASDRRIKAQKIINALTVLIKYLKSH